MPPRDARMSLRLWKLEACGNSAPSSSCSSSATCSTIFTKNDTDSPVPQRKPPRSSISAQLQRLHEFSSLSDLTPSTAQLDKVGESQLCAGGRSGRGVYDAEGFFFGSGDETVEEEEGHGGEPRTKQRGRPRTLPPRMAVPSSSSSSCGTSTAAGHVRGPYEPLVLSSPDDPAVIEVPASINSRLFDYQKEGVKFLYNLYKKNIGGVLGDDMGLGKTIQTIAFLSAVIREKTCKTGINDCKGASPSHLNKDGPVLIVCPTSVINNWGNEFAGWGNFNYSLYHGPNRDLVLEKLANGSVDILITSFDTFRNQSQTICKIDWDIVIVDEAHRLKNEKSQLYNACLGFKTRRRYGLTGTIMQNKILELFNLFDWISPGSLGTREHFRDFYDEPLKHGQRLSAPERFIQIADERKQHLSDVLRKYLLRRTKAETIGHLMLGKEDNVVFCTMSEVQKRAYRRMLAQPEIQCLINKDLACSCGSPLKQVECCKRIVPNGILWSYLHKDNPDGCESCPFCLVLPCILKLQQISNHLELIKPNPRDEMEKQKKDAELASAILDSDVKLIGGNTQIENFMELSDVEHCGKMRALEKLMFMWLSNGDKILLFSYSVRMLNILEKFLIRKGYCFSRLDGSTPMTSRQSLVDDFNNSPSKQVFLISTRAGGLGLNLVSANRVVIFDPNWNPAHDLQAQDRSFRFGQKRHVIVFRLLAAGSVEELVYYRQVYKQQLSNIAVAGKEEKRYFEGVQDCKEFKGELFGISNIFRDLVDKLSTNEITELHENRQNYNGEENDTLLSVNMENEARLDELGIEYSHRNEDVVNMRPGTSRDKDTGVSVNDDRPLFVKHTGSEHSAVSVLNEKRSLWKWKRDEYAHIAQFLGMNELDLSRWILSAPPSELSELLQKYKEWKLH